MTWEKVNKLPELQTQFGKGSGGGIRSYESGSSGSWGPAGDTIFWDPNQKSLFNKNGQLVGKTDAHYTGVARRDYVDIAKRK